MGLPVVQACPLPGRPCPVKVERPTGTNDLDRAGAVWLPLVRDGWHTAVVVVAGPSRSVGVHGAEPLAAGGDWVRVHGPEVLAAGGELVRVDGGREGA